MKRTLIGLAFSLTGAIFDAAILCAAAFLMKAAGASGPRFWYVLFSPPGLSGGTVGLSLGIPFLLATGLMTFGIVLLFIELCRKSDQV